MSRAFVFSRDKDGESVKKPSYHGNERRRENRRKGPRREEIRFEPGKKDRRQETGRRSTDGNLRGKNHNQ